MRIEAIASSFPERVVETEEVLDIIRSKSKVSFHGDLERTLKKISAIVKRSGIRQRRWLAPGDTAFAHIETAILKALEEADVGVDEVDLLIYASVDRQIREPGHSFLIAKAMGMSQAHCFDIIEACAGFGRAAHVAQAMLKSGDYKRILIVTSEFNCHEGGWGHCGHQLCSENDLPWAFSTFTIGEAATATLFGVGGEDWKFDLACRPDYAHLCMAPIADVQSETTSTIGSTSVAGKGGPRFVAWGLEMEKHGVPLIKEMLFRRLDWIDSSKILIPHSHSKRAWIDVAHSVAESQGQSRNWPFYFICETFGNVVSSSIPASLSMAVRNQKLQRGDRVTVLMTAAGLSFGVYTFEY